MFSPVDGRPPSISPESLPQLARVDNAAFKFAGFGKEAFELLDQLAAAPHITTYRELKADLQTAILDPFKAYRDDQVVGWVLPNLLDLETERNVFSRFLKNDFGAGGCHSHLWMSFYRMGRTRLKDLQLAHSLGPRGLTLGVYAAKSMGTAYAVAKRVLLEDEGRARIRLILDEARGLSVAARKGARRDAALPNGSFDGLWIRTRIDRHDVLALGDRLGAEVCRIVQTLWPIYYALLGGQSSE